MSKEGRCLMGRGIVSIHVHRIRYSECSFGFGGCFFYVMRTLRLSYLSTAFLTTIFKDFFFVHLGRGRIKVIN